MTSKVTELLTSALALSPAEREELADCLWSSLDEPDAFGDLTEDELVAELDRRAAVLLDSVILLGISRREQVTEAGTHRVNQDYVSEIENGVRIILQRKRRSKRRIHGIAEGDSPGTEEPEMHPHRR